MEFGRWTRVLPAAVLLLAGCKGFWQDPNSSSASFTLSNSGNISVSPGNSGTSTITVTPANSFTGTVALACTVSSSPSSATSPATCSLSSSSVSITSTTAETSTLSVATSASTTTGTYDVTVTGTSGSTSKTTTVCAEVSATSGSCSATASSGVFYVLNQATNQIAALSISSSGSLTTIGTTTPPSPMPLAIAIAPNGKFLYVSTSGGIYLYTIASNGALSIGNSGSAISSDQAITMSVDSTNTWLVDAVSASTQLLALNVNSSTGAPAIVGEAEQQLLGGLPAATPVQLAISPNDSSSCTTCYVFVAMGTGGTEIVHFNPGNSNPFGTAYHLNLVNSSGGANAVAADPAGKFLYVGEADALPSATQSGGLRVLTIGSGGVTEISGSPYAVGGTGPSSIVATSDGSYVYVASRSVSGSSNDAIASFSVSSSGLTSVKTTTAGPTGLLSLAEDSSGSYLLAVDFSGNPDLDAYTMNAGSLTSTLTSTTGTDPVNAVAIAALP